MEQKTKTGNKTGVAPIPLHQGLWFWTGVSTPGSLGSFQTNLFFECTADVEQRQGRRGSVMTRSRCWRQEAAQDTYEAFDYRGDTEIRNSVFVTGYCTETTKRQELGSGRWRRPVKEPSDKVCSPTGSSATRSHGYGRRQGPRKLFSQAEIGIAVLVC